MRIEDVMTPNPACCTPKTGLEEVARMMGEHDCGQIPLVRSTADPKVLGVVTDRDIVLRLVAEGRNPLKLRAEACMSQPVVTVRTDDSIEECIRVMEVYSIRRVPVVDGDGLLRGMVSQADIAQHASPVSTGEMVRRVSEDGRVRPTKAKVKGPVKPVVAKALLNRGAVDAPGKRHRKPDVPEAINKRMGEPSGKKMGQKSVKAGRAR